MQLGGMIQVERKVIIQSWLFQSFSIIRTQLQVITIKSLRQANKEFIDYQEMCTKAPKSSLFSTLSQDLSEVNYYLSN